MPQKPTKDEYGTVVKPSRQAPHGYGLCEACRHPNIFLNARGQITEHCVLGTADRCPGSLSAPANAGGKKIFLLITQQAADRSRPIYHDRFCFLAPTVAAAEQGARAWMRYQGMDPRDVLVRTMLPGEVTGEYMHDDWIPR
jgi:hypothetical protein